MPVKTDMHATALNNGTRLHAHASVLSWPCAFKIISGTPILVNVPASAINPVLTLTKFGILLPADAFAKINPLALLCRTGMNQPVNASANPGNTDAHRTTSGIQLPVNVSAPTKGLATPLRVGVK